MGDRGHKDKGKKEPKKKPQHTQKEKRQLKRDKKNKAGNIVMPRLLVTSH